MCLLMEIDDLIYIILSINSYNVNNNNICIFYRNDPNDGSQL